MTRIRIAVSVLLIWFFSIFLLERWSPVLQFSPAALFLLPATGLAVMAIPWLQRLKSVIVLAALLVILVLAKLATGAPIIGAALATTILEACALLLTGLLARWASAGITSFETAVSRMLVGQEGERRARYGEVYREVRRARLHQRPLTVLALRYAGGSVNQALERILREAREAIATRYLHARLSEVLSESIDDTNIIAWRGDYFLVVMPEAAPEALPAMLQHLRHASQEKTGVAVNIGAACLPGDATTLDGLIEKAMEAMQADEAASPSLLPQPGSNLRRGARAITEVSHANVDRQ